MSSKILKLIFGTKFWLRKGNFIPKKNFWKLRENVQEIMPEVQPCIAYSPPDAQDYFEKLAPDFELICQVGETLGQRLDHVLTTCLQDGYGQAAAISSDSPTLPPTLIAQTFTKLQKADTDLVLGPSEDGGYYLIGWDKPHPRLVREVPMSTPTVLADTLALAEEDGVAVHLLASWYDVDTIDFYN